MNGKNMTEKDKVIAEAMKGINKKYGDNTILNMDEENIVDVEAISTNSLLLDNVFSCGGLPRGRIIEVFGQESSGKSTLALFLIAQVQKTGGNAVYVDVEFSFSKDYAEKIGVDTDKLIVSQPNSGEEALQIIDTMTKTNSIDVIVLDSVAALVPQKELEGEIGDVGVAVQARMMSKAMRILAGNVAKTKTSLIFINQMRDKVGVFFGNKETTPGGKALKFFSSVRLEVRKGKKILDSKDEVVGNWLNICAVKNKVGFPWRKAEMELIFASGLDLNGDLLDAALKIGVVTRSGTTYYFGKEKLGVGRERSKKKIASDKELFINIKKLYGEKKFPTKATPQAEASGEKKA